MEFDCGDAEIQDREILPGSDTALIKLLVGSWLPRLETGDGG